MSARIRALLASDNVINLDGPEDVDVDEPDVVGVDEPDVVIMDEPDVGVNERAVDEPDVGVNEPAVDEPEPAVDEPEPTVDEPDVGAGMPFEARPYQVELLQAAKRDNIVAFLETGAGKTLISALLIKDVLERTRGKNMFAVFIVDRIPLVVQQASYVAKVLGDKVATATFYGDMGVDHWGEKRWAESINGKNALFLTAQVLLSALRHDVIHFEKISLLIFDEAHHATKSHPFNSIMREFYFPSLREGHALPRIFGMSASPVKAKVKAAKGVESQAYCLDTIAALEQNLQARVVVASSETRAVLDSCAPKPDEFILKYASARDSVMVATGQENIVGSSVGKIASDCADNLPESVQEVGYELGSFVAGQLSKPSVAAIDSIPNSPPQLGSVSPKVLALLELVVFECRRWRELPDVDSTFRCIVFVQRRNVAVGLAWLINQVLGACGTPCLEARIALGTRTPSAIMPRAMRTTQSQQITALKDFREGRFGILVATNVVEEGLDIAACGLVVMFNDVPTSKSYIQSRGRARHRSARYVMMVPESVPSALENIRLVRDGAEAMHTVVRSLSTAATLKNGSLSDIGLPDVDMADDHCLRSKSTRARVSPSAAVDLINTYCGSLPKDLDAQKNGTYGPVYNVDMCAGEGFVATVSLPPASPVSKGVCREPKVSHGRARRLAALDAYTQLYECGALDEHLFPRSYARRYHDPPVATNGQNTPRRRGKGKQRERDVVIEPPRELRWPRPPPDERRCETVHLYEISSEAATLAESNVPPHILAVRGSHRLGIITKHRLHDADLCAFKAPKGEALLTLIARSCFDLSPERDILATKYGLAVYQTANDNADIIQTRRSPEHVSLSTVCPGDLEMPGFHLLPLTKDSGFVDWAAVERLVDFQPWAWPTMHTGSGTAKNAAADLEYSLVQSQHDATYRIYFTGALDQTKTAMSSCKKFVGGGAFPTFLTYYRDRHRVSIRNCNVPLLAGYSKQSVGEQLQGPFYLVPEICRSIPLSPWVLYHMSLMPFWQTFLALQEFRRRCAIDDAIGFTELATALQPRRSSPHCVGVSYERLEFLGDAILKALVSIAAFCEHPAYNEGELTSARDALVSNAYLCDRSVALDLFNVVALTGSAVKTKSWPFYLACPQKAGRSMSEKLLADCIESLLGVYYTKGGLRMSARLLSELEIVPAMLAHLEHPFEQPSRVPRDVTSVSDHRAESPRIAKLEKILNYNFKRKELLVEALTHSSYRNSEVRSYERLEFLGDAVIGFLLLKDFFEKYKHLDPAELTLMREPALSNELFARVSCNFGFEKFLWSDSLILDKDLAVAVKAFENEADDEDVCETLAVSKVLGDMLESIIGAVVVDQDMTLDAADVMVHRLMDPVLHRFANPATMCRHPVTEMTQALQAHYKAGPEFRFEQSEGSQPTTTCAVLVNGVEIASAKGTSRSKAKRSAALSVLQRMEATSSRAGEAPLKRARRGPLAIAGT